MSDALSLSMLTAPSEAGFAHSNAARATMPLAPRSPEQPITQTLPRIPRVVVVPQNTPVPAPAQAIPRSTAERMVLARERIRAAADAGQRIRSYEVALDLDMSEFHFARQFRAAFGRSPHVYYDEVRAAKARNLLEEGMSEGEVARRVGFRRPAELRALLNKR